MHFTEAARSSSRSPALYAYIRPLSEIPALVIEVYRNHVLRRKRNFLIPTDLDDAAFTGDDLIESSSVLEFHRDNLITDACFFCLFQDVDTSTRNWNYTFHFIPQGLKFSEGLHITPPGVGCPCLGKGRQRLTMCEPCATFRGEEPRPR